MPYRISIKGHEDVRVETHKGRKLKSDWKDYKNGDTDNHVIEIGTFTGTISDIYNFKRIDDPAQDKEMRDNAEKMKEIDRQHFSEYKKWYDKPPEEKADRLAFVRSWEQVITGDDTIPEKRRNWYEQALYWFFVNNPNRTLPDLKLLSAVLPKEQVAADTQAEHMFRGGGVRLMVQMLRHDKRYASRR
jgi:hypothetical protein